MASERVVVRFDAQGARTVARDIGNIGKESSQAAIHAHRLKNALRGLAVAFGALKLKDLTDTYISLQNRIKFVTQGHAQLAVVTDQLFGVAQRTRASWADVTDQYSRARFALERLGISSNDTVKFVETLNQMVALSGATTAEASGALRQYSQSLASGRLQAQEWNSIAEQIPPLAQAIADELKLSIGDVKKYIEQNRVGADRLYAAVVKVADVYKEKFANSTPTVAQGLILVNNAFTKSIGEMDKFLGISTKVVNAMRFIADNSDLVVKAGVALAAMLTVVLGPALLSIIARYTIIAALKNPWQAMIAGVVGAGAALYTFGDQMKLTQDGLTTVQDFAIAAWNKIKTSASDMVDTVKAKYPGLGKAFQSLVDTHEQGYRGIIKAAFTAYDTLIAGFKALIKTMTDNWRLMPQVLVEIIWDGLKRAYNIFISFFGDTLTAMGEFFKKIATGRWSEAFSGQWTAEFGEAGKVVANSFGENFIAEFERSTAGRDLFNTLLGEADVIAEERHQKELLRAQEEMIAWGQLGQAKAAALTSTDGTGTKDKKKGFEDYLKELQREQQLGLATGDAYKILNEQIEIANKLRKDLTDTQKQQVAEAVRENLELERKRNLLEEIRGPTEEYNLKVQALTELYSSGAITLGEYNAKFAELREHWLNGLPEATTFVDGFTIQMEKMNLAAQKGMGGIGKEVAQIFGPGGTLISGIGDAIAQSIVFGKSFKDQIRQVAQSILSQLISSLVKVGLNMLMMGITGQTQMAAATAMGTAQAATLTAAYAPAAAMSSLATGGANAAGASTGIASVFSILASLAGSLFQGFESGGYTGAIGKKDIAGVVHGQEFVVNAKATARNRSLLEAINKGKDPIAPVVQAAKAPSTNVSITNEIPEAQYEVRQISEFDVEIIARRVLQREGASVVANDLRNPNSRMSKSLGANTTAGRRR